MEQQQFNQESTIILVSSQSTDTSLPPENVTVFSPYIYGGIAVGIIFALTAYSKSLMHSVNKLVETLLKSKKK